MADFFHAPFPPSLGIPGGYPLRWLERGPEEQLRASWHCLPEVKVGPGWGAGHLLWPLWWQETSEVVVPLLRRSPRCPHLWGLAQCLAGAPRDLSSAAGWWPRVAARGDRPWSSPASYDKQVRRDPLALLPMTKEALRCG